MRYAAFAILFLTIVVGGAYYLRPDTDGRATSGSGVEVPVPPLKSFTLEVKDRKLVSGSSTLTVKQGDQVSITITADESDELHLHGYDKSVEFEANTLATLSFTADRSGRFPFEMEGSATGLGELHVEP